VVVKTAMLASKCVYVYGVTFAYLQKLCMPMCPRSFSAALYIDWMYPLANQRSFAFHGHTAWNSLPSALRDSSLPNSENTIRRRRGVSAILVPPSQEVGSA